MGVVAGFLAGIGMMKWPYLKRALPVSVRRYLQIRSYFRSINKTRNQFDANGVFIAVSALGDVGTMMAIKQQQDGMIAFA